MFTPSPRLRVRRAAHSVLAIALTLSALAVVELAGPSVAEAAVPPVVDTTPAQVTVDPLPTVQINGVVWDQEIVGNTVYVAGEFSQARPAGAPPGVNQTPRSNLLAFDVTTGQLIQAFAPTVNNTVKTVVAAPDGSRIYIGGNFTSIDGINRYRIAALDPTTGAVITSFNAGLDYRVNDIAATATAVYVVGAFSQVGSEPRVRMAAFAPSNGALLAWAPSADREVHTVVVSTDGSRVFVGGKFLNISGASAYGMGALDPTTGALIPWAANTVIKNGGPDGAILDMRASGDAIYGGGYTYGRSQGNLEGVFRANAATGAIDWVEDCHGDTYQMAPVNGLVYKATHAHYCGNVGGMPQSDNTNNQWHHNMRNGLAFRDAASGNALREQWSYHNFEGMPAPSLTNWFPEFAGGTFTGLGQSAWSVEGNSDYVVFGGEFPSVNAVGQQGIARFAVRPIAPGNSGPRLSSNTFPIKVTSPAAGRVRISFPANYDRDDAVLTYRITRNGTTIHTMQAASTYYDQPTLSFVDSGLTAGQSYSYRVTATDNDNNAAQSNLIPVTVAASGPSTAYADRIIADGPRIYWRLGEPSGPSAQDSAAFQTGTANDMQFGRPGAILGDSDTAVSPNSTSSRIVQPPFVNYANQNERHPVVHQLSVEAWFKTSSTQGGRLLGFGNSNSGTSSSSTSDRMLYVSNNGRVLFGVRTAAEHTGYTSSRQNRTIESPSGLNDGQWHHVVGTLAADGMQLYVDGVRVASRDDVNSGHGYYGYWRVGADTLSNWTAAPSSTRLNGDIDEAAVYYHQLSAPQIAAHYTASGRTPAVTPAPSDAYGAAVQALDPYLYYRLAEPSGSVANDSGIRQHTGDYAGSTTKAQPGVLAGNASVAFNGNGSGSVSNRDRLDTPGELSLETWVNTTTTSGGKLIGFGNSRTGLSSTSDRHVYLRNDGRPVFGVGGNNPTEITGATAVNDGQWHHIVATLGTGGMALYVDGALVGSAPNEVGGSYRGYWRIGGDTTPASSTAAYLTGRLDETAVYDRVLTPAQVLQHLQLGGGQVANVPPTAAFGATADFLSLTFNGSASNDPDGSIASYAWNFGDGNTSSGVSPTATHAYSQAGTYTVTLTVTDNSGAIGQVSHTYDVAAPPPPNSPPTAAFTFGTSGLRVDVDGSTSGDSDGTVASYSWAFGDGGTATGLLASHDYGAGGTYTVTLTVTDDDGATGTTTQNVTVSAPPGPVTYAADQFGRSVGSGFGSADTGGPWTLQGSAANYAVTGGQGQHRLGGGGWTLASYLNGVSADQVIASVDVAFDKAPTGGGIYSSLVVRRVGTTEYRVTLRALPTSTTLTLSRVVNGSSTNLSAVTVPGLVYTPGDVLRLQLRAAGSGTTALDARVWKVGNPQPTGWDVSATDSTAALQGPGGVGLVTYLSGSTTNAPVVALYDELLVTGL